MRVGREWEKLCKREKEELKVERKEENVRRYVVV